MRDTLHQVLSQSAGLEWVNTCGVSAERLARWRERQLEEKKRKGQADPRLIYYADFYDLTTIVRRSWDKGLSNIFHDLKEVEVLLKILDELRNREAHRREFLPFEEQLAAGISGRIRSKITQYYSLMETSDSYYPRFEFAQDSVGNVYSIGEGKSVTSSVKLRPGEEVQFKLVASDPLGEVVEYLVYPNSSEGITAARSGRAQWNETGSFSFEILPEYVGERFIFIAAVRSKREFHAQKEHVIGKIDDKVNFNYEVLPPRCR